MSRSRVIDFLPAIYHQFVPELFDRPLEEERHATCRECAMCAPALPERPPEAYFSPSTKCCTYHPELPNYAVGGLLLDASEAGREGRRRMREKIAHRAGVEPFGIGPPPLVQLLLTRGQAGFGRASSLVCPYLDAELGLCTVWAQRDGVCATWFCKHNNGMDGRTFWSSLRVYLQETERLLAWHALRELGFEAPAILDGGRRSWRLDTNALDDSAPPEDRYAALWGDWMGREEELYVSAYRIVGALDRAAFASLGGLRHQLLLESVATSHRALTDPTLPDPLVKNPSMRVDREPNGTRVLTTYSGFDPTRVRKNVFDLLDHFDGRRPTAEVCAAIEAESARPVTDSFIVQLYQRRILVDPTSPA